VEARFQLRQVAVERVVIEDPILRAQKLAELGAYRSRYLPSTVRLQQCFRAGRISPLGHVEHRLSSGKTYPYGFGWNIDEWGGKQVLAHGALGRGSRCSFPAGWVTMNWRWLFSATGWESV
jgi:hypothetical protein